MKKQEKPPGALDPALVLPPQGGVKYVTVTQDKSPCLRSERHNEYFFGRAKTGGLGHLVSRSCHAGAVAKFDFQLCRSRKDGNKVLRKAESSSSDA